MQQTQRQAALKHLLREIDSLVDRYPRLIHTWRFAASAVWALDRYYAADAERPPRVIPEQDFVRDTKENIKGLLGNGVVSRDWERGFWFNAAIMRLDALWERVFKLFLPDGVDCSGPSLYFLVEDRRSTPSRLEYKNSSFGQIRQIVNQLKHEPGGAHPNIRENRELPIQAIGDLLAVLKDSGLQRILVPMLQGPVLAGRRKRGVRPVV